MAGQGSKRTQFQKGKSGNPKGRKPRQVESKLVDLWRKTFTDKALSKILKVLLDQAEAGEPWAIREVMDRMFPVTHIAQEMNKDAENLNPIAEAFRALMEKKKGK